MWFNISTLANEEEQNYQEALKTITVSKAAIEAYKKEIDKIKATISVYNELVSNTQNQYNQIM